MGIPVILLTAKGGTEDRVIGYQSGADAYLPKPFDPDELLSIIQSLLYNYDALLNTSINNINTSFDNVQRDLQDIKLLLLQQQQQQESNNNNAIGKKDNKWMNNSNKNIFFIPDEKKVLELLCLGLTNKEIANRMFISQRRVEQHLTNMFRKTNVSNRTELVRYAVSTGNVKL